jgi:hypothetical protein
VREPEGITTPPPAPPRRLWGHRGGSRLRHDGPSGQEEFAAVEADDVAQTGPKLMFHQVPDATTV